MADITPKKRACIWVFHEHCQASTRDISKLYFQVIFMERAFPNRGGIFQQDLAPCHTAKKVKKFFEENHIKVLDWPGNLPNLNPIENLWSIVKNRLLKRDCTTQMKLINAIIDVWYHNQKVTQNCEKLVESMPKRVKKLITNRGGHISY